MISKDLKEYLVYNLTLIGNDIDDYVEYANKIYESYKIGVLKIDDNKYKCFIDDLAYNNSMILNETFNNEEDAKWRAIQELNMYISY